MARGWAYLWWIRMKIGRTHHWMPTAQKAVGFQSEDGDLLVTDLLARVSRGWSNIVMRVNMLFFLKSAHFPQRCEPLFLSFYPRHGCCNMFRLPIEGTGSPLWSNQGVGYTEEEKSNLSLLIKKKISPCVTPWLVQTGDPFPLLKGRTIYLDHNETRRKVGLQN